MSSVKLVTITPDAEKTIAYLARVSSSNQENPEYAKLIKYLVDHRHHSPFEMVHAVFEIVTSRAVAAQILRHRSFSFQEFSQRYAEVTDLPPLVDGRRQAVKNRQSSVDSIEDNDAWLDLQAETYNSAMVAYDTALKLGVAREQARMLLPLATPTRLFMAGSVRSWLHYCLLRCEEDTQAEHRAIAEQCRSILVKELPVVAEAMGWTT